MKIHPQNNFAFEKKLVAKCKVGTGENRQKAKIYEIEYPQDITYLHKISLDEDWNGNFYIDQIEDDFENAPKKPNEHFYVMEDSKGNCLCISELDKANEKQNSLDFIETAPFLSTYNRNGNRIRYIGETMLAFLVKLTKNENKKRFFIPLVANRERTLNFYYVQCGFNRQGTTGSLVKKNYDKFIHSNEQHTNSSINLVN